LLLTLALRAAPPPGCCWLLLLLLLLLALELENKQQERLGCVLPCLG